MWIYGLSKLGFRQRELHRLRRACLMLSAILGVWLAIAAAAVTGEKPVASPPRTGFRGVFFNPNIQHPQFAGYPWPTFDFYGPGYRDKIREALRGLADEASINFIDLFVPIPFTLARPAEAPQADQPLAEWANVAYLDNLAVFLDDCSEVGISVELDLADNRWIPYSVDSSHHIGRPEGGCWPVASDAPWKESATWYRQVIEYVEHRTKHPESIAMWCMMGHYSLGTAEPELWACDDLPVKLAFTEKFVKGVWPAFRSAGKRPKAAPYALPVFSNDAYWMAKTPDERLSGFIHLKKWIVDDLALSPDYWPMTTYPYCDPAPDGVYYLRRIVEILGPENASRILSTDFKGPGHDQELNDSIISAQGHSGRDMLQWHFQKCVEHHFAGWWIFSYQDHGPLFEGERTGAQDVAGHLKEILKPQTGIRTADGQWKADLLPILRQQSPQ